METITKNLEQLIREGLQESISYDEYSTLIIELAEQEKTTGENQDEDLIYYTKLNAQRAKRLNKTSVVDEESKEIVSSLQQKYTWLVLTESWCGDAAQVLPLLNKLAELNANIDLRLVLRDENTGLMDEFLTNGGRSIPKVIMLDESAKVVGTWGPRPIEAQAFYDSWRNNPDKPPYKEFQVDMQKWYLKDKGQSTFSEIGEILKQLED